MSTPLLIEIDESASVAVILKRLASAGLTLQHRHEAAPLLTLVANNDMARTFLERKRQIVAEVDATRALFSPDALARLDAEMEASRQRSLDAGID